MSATEVGALAIKTPTNQIPLQPQVVAHQVSELLTPDALVAFDCGSNRFFAARHIDILLSFGRSDRPAGAIYSFKQQLGGLEAIVQVLGLGMIVPVAHDLAMISPVRSVCCAYRGANPDTEMQGRIEELADKSTEGRLTRACFPLLLQHLPRPTDRRALQSK